MTYRTMRHPAFPRGAEYYTFQRSDTRQRIAGRFIEPIAYAVGVIVGAVAYREYQLGYGGLWKVVAISGNGKYVKVAGVSIDGDVISVRERWMHGHLLYQVARDVSEYLLVRRIKSLEVEAENAKAVAERVAMQKAFELSKNTVTRALVHAHSNDYCSETAVALISAGHKMPDATLEFTVTLDVTAHLRGNDSYYALRELFGKAEGDPTGKDRLVNEYSNRVESVITEALERGDYQMNTVIHTGTDVEFKAPSIRLTSFSEAQAQITT